MWYACGFTVLKSFRYMWNGNSIVRDFDEGLTLDLAKNNGSLAPVASGVLQIEPIRDFDPKNYFELLLLDYKYSKSSIPLKGFVVIPAALHLKLMYKLDGFSVPLPGATILYVYAGLFGKLKYITEFGLVVDLSSLPEPLTLRSIDTLYN